MARQDNLIDSPVYHIPINFLSDEVDGSALRCTSPPGHRECQRYKLVCILFLIRENDQALSIFNLKYTQLTGDRLIIECQCKYLNIFQSLTLHIYADYEV